MIFGKHINKYYIKYGLWLLLGLVALALVDYMQLVIPNLYQQVINGMNMGYVTVDGARVPFDMDFLLDRVCMPMVGIIVAMVFGRFLWRICIFGAAIKVETGLRNEMFDHAKELDRQCASATCRVNFFLYCKLLRCISAENAVSVNISL